MLKDTDDHEEIITRVAALDIGKAELVACVRVPSDTTPGRRMQEVSTHSTMTRSLLALGDHFRCLGVTRVVMEATSDYWKPPFYLLEAAGFEVWLVNAKDVKHLPGRPKTDKLDAVWLCKVAERQMIRPSFVPPPAIRRLRGPDPLPGRSGQRGHRGEEPGGEAARGRVYQGVVGRVEAVQPVRAGHDARADRR
jgi:transposase